LIDTVGSIPPTKAARIRETGVARDVGHAMRFGRVIVMAVALYPLIWATGFAGALMAALAVVSALYIIRTRIVGLAFLPLCIALLNVMSIPIGVLAFNVDASRAISALYNAGVWIVIAAILDAAAKHDFRRDLSLRLLVVLVVQVLLVFVALQVFPQRLPVPLFSEIASRLPGNFGDLGRPDMVSASWIGRVEMRTSGMMSQAVSAGGFAAAAGLIVASVKTIPWWARALGLAAALPVAYYSLSRTTYALIPVVILAAACVAVAKRNRLVAAGMVSVSLILGLAAAINWRTAILATLDEVDDLRGGSSASRGEVYSATLSYIQAHPFPLLGYGVKPREEGLVASVGTHSTVLGLAFRAGLLAAVFFVVLIVALVARAVREGDVTATIAALFVGVWAVQADLDAGHIIPLLLAFAIGPPGVMGETTLRARGRGRLRR
jgi:O-antigen ligase